MHHFLHKNVSWSPSVTWYFFTQDCDILYKMKLCSDLVFCYRKMWFLIQTRADRSLGGNCAICYKLMWFEAVLWLGVFFTASCNIWHTLSLHFFPELFCLSVANCSDVKCCSLFRRSVSRRHAKTWRRWHKLMARLMETIPRKLAMQSKEKKAFFAVSMAPEWSAELMAAEMALEGSTSGVNPSGVVSHLARLSADRQWCQGFSAVDVRRDTKNGLLDRIPWAVISRAPALLLSSDTVSAAKWPPIPSLSWSRQVNAANRWTLRSLHMDPHRWRILGLIVLSTAKRCAANPLNTAERWLIPTRYEQPVSEPWSPLWHL